MKHSILFFAALSFVSNYSYCGWASRLSVMGCLARSYVVKHINKRFKAIPKVLPQNHVSICSVNKKIHPYCAASIILGASTFRSSCCEEETKEGEWFDLERPNEHIGLSTPLAIAAQIGDSHSLEVLLDAGANINDMGVFGSALHCAAISGRLEIVKQLVDRGADVNQENWDGCLPIYNAIKNGREEIAEYLFDECSNKEILVNTPCGRDTMLNLVIDKNFNALSHKILDSGANISQPNFYGVTPLDSAIEKSNVEMVRVLVDRGATCKLRMLERALATNNLSMFEMMFCVDNFNKVDLEDVLLMASRYGHLDIVKDLYEIGIDIDADSHKSSPLIEASAEGHADVVRFLCSNDARFYKKDMRVLGKLTALDWAIRNQHADVVKVLREFGVTEDGGLFDKDFIKHFLQEQDELFAENLIIIF